LNLWGREKKKKVKKNSDSLFMVKKGPTISWKAKGDTKKGEKVIIPPQQQRKAGRTPFSSKKRTDSWNSADRA